MLSQAHAYIETLAKLIELFGVIIILIGVILATALFLRQSLTGGEG